MSTSGNKVRSKAGSPAIAMLVAMGLLATIGANKTRAADSPAAPSDAVVAPAVALGKAFAAVAARIKPAVVSVYSEHMVTIRRAPFPFPFGDQFFAPFLPPFAQPNPQAQPKEYKIPQRGLGSGMILDRQGHILTNYHVVKDVEEIKVQLADKRTFEAEVVGTDPKTDVAVIKIKGHVPSDLPVVTLGDSDALEDGDLVLAVGAPFGLTQTVTNGIISAKGRSNVGIAAYEDFLQTDAPINPGNSGGPLVNMHGEVIGMNSAIATGGGEGQFGGVGFAIPVNMLKSMLPALTSGRQITRGMLGVGMQDINEDLAKQFNVTGAKGALVSQVNKDSPAEKAGLKPGDVIVRFAGTEIHDTSQLRNLVAASAPGSRVDIEVIRDRQPKTLTVTIGAQSNESRGSRSSPEGADQLNRLGISAQSLTKDLSAQYHLQGVSGVIITNVRDGSPAQLAGLQAGDLIVEADRSPVTDTSELERTLSKDRTQVLLLVKRKGTSLFVVVPFK